MSDCDDFYMVLPSNSSPDIYPENHAADYIVDWGNEIDLHPEDNWKVAMTELSYVYNPITITKDYIIEWHRLKQSLKEYRVKMMLDPLSKDKFNVTEIKYVLGDDIQGAFPDDFIDYFTKTLLSHQNIDENTGYFTIKSPLTNRLEFREDSDKELLGFTNAITYGVKDQNDTWLIQGNKDLRLLIKEKPNEYLNRIFTIRIAVYKYKMLSNRFNFNKNLSFQTAKELVDYMRDNCRNIFGNIIIDTDNKIKVSFQHFVVSISFLKGLHYVLGFKNSTIYAGSVEDLSYPLVTNEYQSVKADFLPQLRRGIINMYIYASICKPINVGHTLVPLLKNVFINSTDDSNENGHARNYIVYNPMYLPVACSRFRNIEINIRNDAGQLIPFPDSAITIMTLHFKKFTKL